MSMRQAMLASGLAAGWLLMLMLTGGAQGKLVDLKPYHAMILKHHNDLRRAVSPSASDMRQIIWDDTLARDAEEWAEYCRYERPRSYLYNSGSNMAYQRYHVNPRNPASIRSSLHQGLRTWAREREAFHYGQGCGRACAYAQMIYSSTHRVGCAMNTCSRLTVGHSREGYSTLFLCLYAPKGRLMQTVPYRKGRECSSCPSGTYCSQGLCAENGLMSSSAALTASRTVSLSASDGPVAALYGPAALSLPQSDTQEVAVSISPRRSRQGSMDKLSNGEVSYLLQVQNMYRAEARHPKLHWDTDLNRWTNWIINCDADYPGPPHTFTNFYRISDSTPIYKVVDEWRNEGMDANIQLEKGCRTPYDHTDCNHFTNMMEDAVTAVACSAKSCEDGTRQLVCLYSSPDSRGQQS